MDTWRYLVLTLVLVVSTYAQQEKWVWDGKTAKAIRNGDRARYGVFDPEGYDEPYRPELRPPPRDLPPLVRPPPPPNQPPPFRPPPPPSHKPDSDPTHFEKCKCVHAFNCKSPGLLFGSCDTGKKYCCEKTIHEGRRDFHPNNEDPEVLAGPGGPIDHIKKPIGRPDRPGLGSFGEQPLPNGGYGSRPDRPLGLGGYGPGAERPLGLGGYGTRPDGQLGLGSYGPRGEGSLDNYGNRPNRPPGGNYGIRADGSLGALDNVNYGRPNIQRS